MRISDWSSDVCSSDLDEAEVAMTLRAVLRDVLGISEERTAAMTESTLLFGNLPEMDSMAVEALLTELEDRLGIVIDAAENDAATFQSYRTTLAFLMCKNLISNTPDADLLPARQHH